MGLETRTAREFTFAIPDDDVPFLCEPEHYVDEARLLCERVLKFPRHERAGYMLEVGACFGITCIPLAADGYFERIFAIEPRTDLYSLLAENISRNKISGITPIRFAVSDYEGMGELDSFCAGNCGAGALDVEPTGQPRWRVPVTTLDRLIETYRIPVGDVRLVWIDAQGSEPKIVRGARNLLTNSNCPFYVELAPELMLLCREDPYLFAHSLAEHFARFIDIRQPDMVFDIVDLPAVARYYHEQIKANGRSQHTNVLLLRS